MIMADIESWKIWILFGGVPTITSGLIAGIWYLISKKVILHWTSNENQKLEEFKSQLNKNSNLLTDILNSQSNAYFLAQEKRLVAVEKIWEATLKIKNEFPSAIILMYTILTEKEIRGILNDFEPKRVIPNQIRNFSAEEYTNKMISDSLNLDQYRIYLDTQIWTCFFVYRAFCGRIAYWVDKGIKNGEIKPWQEDKATKEILGLLFKPNELDTLVKSNTNLQFCLDSIEFKLLNEITELTTGKKYSELYVNQFIKWNGKMKNLTDQT